MRLKDWSPGRIAALSRAAVNHAYGRLRRGECVGEASRLRYWFGDDYRRDASELIVKTLPKLIDADVRQIIRELSNIIATRHLQAEMNVQLKRQS